MAPLKGNNVETQRLSQAFPAMYKARDVSEDQSALRYSGFSLALVEVCFRLANQLLSVPMQCEDIWLDVVDAGHVRRFYADGLRGRESQSSFTFDLLHFLAFRRLAIVHALY